MANVLELKNVTKKYDGFVLDNVTLALPQGCIMGLIGENGAGKSTMINLILNLIKRDSGEINIFEQDLLTHESAIKEDLGVVFDECNFPETLNVEQVEKVMARIYQNWDPQAFWQYIDKFSLPYKKEIKQFSRGMKMKLSIAVALAHKAKLLVLDEATSGLDPIIRDEILDIFLDFIQDEQHAIFISSHITSDIEKIADYITFIHKGKIMFTETKEDLLNNYGICKCTSTEFDNLDPSVIIGSRKNKFGIEVLVRKDQLKGQYVMDHATIEDIMVYTIRGEGQ